MTLFDFKILTDANVHFDVVEFLKRQGCDLITVRDIGSLQPRTRRSWSEP